MNLKILMILGQKQYSLFATLPYQTLQNLCFSPKIEFFVVFSDFF